MQVGFGGLFALNDKTGPGSFIWDQDVTFDLGIDFVPPDPLPLLAGALNEIWVIVNNTGSDDLNAPAQTFAFPGDYSYLSLDAVVTYMPEPPAWSLLAVAGLCVLVGLWRRPAGKRNLRGHALG